MALEEAIVETGPATVAALIAETVSGATIAAVLPPEGYFGRIRVICNRHGVLLILDEVLCGPGRTGRWFAAEHHDVVPDIVTMGKGLAGIDGDATIFGPPFIASSEEMEQIVAALGTAVESVLGS